MTDRVGDVVERLGGVRRPAAPPRVTIEVDYPIPAWALRLATGAVAAGCAALVATGWFQWGVAGALVLGVVAKPWGFATSATAVLAGVAMLGFGPFEGPVHSMVLGVHLLVTLAGAVGNLPWRAAVERRVVTAGLGRFAAVQVVAQATVVTATWVAGVALSAPWVPMAVGVAVATGTWLVVLRLRR